MKPKTISKKEREELRGIVRKGMGAIGYDGEEAFTQLWIAGCESARKDTEQNTETYRLMRSYSDRLVMADEMMQIINEKGFDEEIPIPFSKHFYAMIYCDAEDLMIKCRIFVRKEDAENLDEDDVNAIKTAAESVVAAICRCTDGLFNYYNYSVITGELEAKYMLSLVTGKGLYGDLHKVCAKAADEMFETIYNACY